MFVNKIEPFRIHIEKYRNILIVIFALLVAFIGAKISEISSIFIFEHFPNRVIPNDIFFELIPYNIVYEYFVDFVFLLMIVICFYAVIKYAKETFAYYWILAWSYMIFRAGVNVMTPFARPLAPDNLHGALRLLENSFIDNHGFWPMGMFPSGHLGFATIAYIAVRDVAPLWLDRFMLSLLFLEAIFMIVSRGHYTIDILGAVSFVVLIYLLGEKYLKKYLVMDWKD